MFLVGIRPSNCPSFNACDQTFLNYLPRVCLGLDIHLESIKPVLSGAIK